MTPELIVSHLWQSSAFALAAGLLAFALRHGPPKIRYWIWLSASLKFLMPLALLVSLGTMIPRPAQRIVVVQDSQPVFPFIPVQIDDLPAPASVYSAPPAEAPSNAAPLAIGIPWIIGFFAVAAWRCRGWLRVRAILRFGTPIALPIPIPAFIAPNAAEPGIVGFLRPVLILPPGLLDRLNSRQLDAVLAHEMWHVRRRDNLFAAIHMLVEALFWFNPLVWWIGSRMIEERERACDEAVLQTGCEPSDYVGGILQVCRFHKESSLPCVSGVTGANVKKRLKTILAGSVAREWNAGKKAALATLGLAALAAPILIGILSEPAIRTVFAQSPDARPRFLAADVHAAPSAPVGTLALSLRTVPVYADRYQLDNATLPDMIGIAWGVQTDKIVGGPTWLEMDRFDVTAKLPDNTSPEDRKRMLQTLLEDRFKLVVHKDTKPVPGYTLTANRKPALRPATGSEKSGCESSSARAGLTLTYSCRNITMAAFVEGLRGMAGVDLLLGPGPVVDATGLKGAWNFDLKWTQDYVHFLNVPTARVTIIDALDQQLGLKLEARRVLAPALVVDRVNRTPTANASDLARIMPPILPPTRFDIASVKPSDPGSTRSGIHIQPGGRVTLEGIPMTGLFQLAFSGHIAENMPKWANSDRFEIVAKTAPGTAPLDRTTLGLPLQSLLKERFRLAWHTEQRPGTAYVLRAAKPKMQKADPASHTFCKRDMPLSGSQGGEWSVRYTCRNMTMAQFADWLTHNGIGMSGGLVSDATGLNGAWDFTLMYDTNPVQLTPHPADEASPSGVAPDPTAGYSIFEAIEKQLGLRLQTTKGLQPVMIIDHIEEKPTGQ